MNRRTFLQGALAAGGAPALGAVASPAAVDYDSGLPSPHGVKLTLKPVTTNMIHTGVWEGPCRFNVVSVAEETARVHGHFASWRTQVTDNRIGFDRDLVTVLDPVLMLFDETFEFKSDQFAKIGDDGSAADVFYINPAGSSIAAFEIAKRYRKPVILSMGLNCRTVDIAAYARSNGLEVYVPQGTEELNRTLSLLRARKVFGMTKILYPTDWGWPSVASVAGINKPQELAERFGVELVKISYARLAREVERALENAEERQHAERIAEAVIQGADRSFLDRKYVIRSIEFYRTACRLMEQNRCNAFTIECFEFCSSRLPEKWDVTPCLLHTFFKDQGIPSACEGDLAALLSMQLLMAVSKKSSHLGNMFFREGRKLEINHSAPGIRMNGPDKPGLPYQLGRFVESGWGAKAVVDFMNNPEKRVTVARMNPTATGLLVLKGRLVGSGGWGEDRLGCSVSAFLVGAESGTAETFVRRQSEYGNHLVWVYGDYADELEFLGAMLGIEVEVVT
jgi:hypothetical protein